MRSNVGVMRGRTRVGVHHTEIYHTKKYNKLYWDIMNSKKAYQQVNGKQSPELKRFMYAVYKKKVKKLDMAYKKGLLK